VIAESDGTRAEKGRLGKDTARSGAHQVYDIGNLLLMSLIEGKWVPLVQDMKESYLSEALRLTADLAPKQHRSYYPFMPVAASVLSLFHFVKMELQIIV
jgi:hypothetical protein